jgi:glycosyltransferase involved in cell wall biosynthesis
MSNLAIIIPAFKEIFLEETLRSISEQTNKNFNIYIGNDASPGDIGSIVAKFQPVLNITYKEFTENLGGKDLVAHWQRCIDMAGHEEWLWLFSDDDLMDPGCVQQFLNTLDSSPAFDIYHFNIKIINEKGDIIKTPLSFPELISSEEFISLRLNDKISTFVVEYVFRKNKFQITGGFQHFDLAWGSDDATWIKTSIPNGIRTISGASVYWRNSPYNISPNTSNRQILLRKSDAEIQFAVWILALAKSGDIDLDPETLKSLLKKGFLLRLTHRSLYISLHEQRALLANFSDNTKTNKTTVDNMQLFYFKLIKTVQTLVKPPLKKIMSFVGLKRK